MAWKSLHHPDISMKVLRRQAGTALLDFIAESAVIMMTRGRSLTWSRQSGPPSSYRMAVSRLRRAGLIAYRQTGDRPPVLQVTARGEELRSPLHRLERCWKRKWQGRWYVLTYDIPEKHRAYRDHLRWFLARQRMGRLQQSLWVSPDDIRADFHDLVQAAELDRYAFLLEARNVLGRSDREVAERAWPMEILAERQARYLAVYEENFKRLISRPQSAEDLFALVRQETADYTAVLRDDPLLPEALWPPSYRGPQVVELHRRTLRAVGERL